MNAYHETIGPNIPEGHGVQVDCPMLAKVFALHCIRLVPPIQANPRVTKYCYSVSRW